MIHKFSTKQAQKPVLDGDQLQALATDLTETREGAIVGGRANDKISIDAFDALEAPTTALAENPFSTTTKLGSAVQRSNSYYEPHRGAGMIGKVIVESAES